MLQLRLPTILKVLALLSLVAVVTAGQARASAELEPRETVKRAVDEIVGILSDPELATDEAREQRHRLVVEQVEKFFDFDEISMRVLGPRWRDLDDEQRRQFVELFKKFLERNYINRVDQYSDEKVVVRAQEVREDSRGNRYARVQTDFIIGDQQVPVDYRMIERDERWVVYDVRVEGVSLVRNFRSQFDPYSYGELISRMQEQIATGEGFELDELEVL
ncbi:MAG: ABC transporter substrate-binding protein [Desulfurivibrio sp.]|nr:ABC transporter substrate-binding protein [Desulfurivibrio sp.]